MPSDIFAKLGDIKGESLDAKHKDEIEVLSFSWGVANTVAPGGGGGGGVGKATFHDLSFVHRIDSASPLLMKALASAQTSAEIEAVLTVARPGDGAKDKSFTTIDVYDFDKRAYADVQRAAITRLSALAQTQAERVRVALSRSTVAHFSDGQTGLLRII